MSGTEIVDALRAAPLFSSLGDGVVDELAASSRIRSYRQGQLVFEVDEAGNSLALIATGRVKIAVRSADGGELVLTWLGPGETLGELSVIDGGRRSADVEAVEDSTIVQIDRDAVLRAMRADPDFAHNIARAVAAGMRRLTEATADLVFLDLPRRVGKWLIEQGDGSDHIDVAISQEELAHHVGGTRQS